MRDIFQDRWKADALAWQYFRVIFPVTREKLKDKYKLACDRMRPGIFKSNTRPEFMEMRDFYHGLLEHNPPWAFKEGPVAGSPSPPLPKRRFHPRPDPVPPSRAREDALNMVETADQERVAKDREFAMTMMELGVKRQAMGLDE